MYKHRPHECVALLQAMEEARDDLNTDECQGWLCHARHFSPCCMARENSSADVDDVLRPDQDQSDLFHCSLQLFFVVVSSAEHFVLK